MSDLATLAATAVDVPGLVIEISSGERTRIVDGKVLKTTEERVTCFVGKDSLEFSNVADALLAIKLHQMLATATVVAGARSVSSPPISPPAAEAIVDAPAEGKPKRRRASKGAAEATPPLERPAVKKGLPGPPRPKAPASGNGSISLAEADRELARGEQIAPITVSAPAATSSFADRQSRMGGPKQTADPNRVRVAMGPTVI